VPATIFCAQSNEYGRGNPAFPRPLHVLALSARNPEALGALVQRYAQALDGPELVSESLEDLFLNMTTRLEDRA